MCLMGNRCYKEGDYNKAFEYYTKSAELGDTNAHCLLSIMYQYGEGVEKDQTKEVYHPNKLPLPGIHMPGIILVA